MKMQQDVASDFTSAPLRRARSATTLRLRRLMEEQQRIEIGNRIRQLRDASPHTNRSIAEHVGVGERAVANWVAGTTGITYDNAKKVAELFDRDPTWLWAGGPQTPDLVGALGADPYAEQLDRIEELVREVLKEVRESRESERDHGDDADLGDELSELGHDDEAGEPPAEAGGQS